MGPLRVAPIAGGGPLIRLVVSVVELAAPAALTGVCECVRLETEAVVDVPVAELLLTFKWVSDACFPFWFRAPPMTPPEEVLEDPPSTIVLPRLRILLVVECDVVACLLPMTRSAFYLLVRWCSLRAY